MQNADNHPDFAQVSELLDRLVLSQQIPCANVLIRQNGRELFYHQSGLSDIAEKKPISRDTIFRLFSMTKPAIAVAVMILVDEGSISLDDDIADYIPEFKNLRAYVSGEGDNIQTEPARTITVKHLLTHTAGFSYWFQLANPVGALYAGAPGIDHEQWRFDPEFGGLDGLARVLGQLPLIAQPGVNWHYSMSFEVAGILIERASGEKLDTFMKRKIFDPLGMQDTAFSVEPGKADRLASLYTPDEAGGIKLVEKGADSRLLKPVPGLAGGGGLVSTIDDYSRFAEMLLNGGEWQGVHILSEQSVRAIMSDHLTPAQLGELPELAKWGLGGDGDGMGFGLGGAAVVAPPASGVPVFPGEYSWGGGTSTTFWVDPVNDVTVVFMTQRFPPSIGMPRDQLHVAVYAALGLS